MRKILSIAKNSLKEAIRGNILWAVFIFSIFVILASVAFGSVSIGEQYRVVKSFGYFITSLSGIITCIIAGVTLFQKEINQKTIYNILSKAVSREEFLLGKWLGLCGTSILLSALMLLSLQLIVLFIQGSIDPLFLHAFLCMSLEIAIIASLTVFFSTMAVTPILPGLFSFSFFVAGRSIKYLSTYLIAEGGNSVSSYAVNLLNFILPDLRSFALYDNFVYDTGLNIQSLISLTAYALSYTAFFLFISTVIFRRREF